MQGIHPRIWFWRLEGKVKHLLLPSRFKELYKKSRPLMTILEAKQLYDLAKKNARQGILVEIGSAWGGSACLLSQASKEASRNKVYCVDSWSSPEKSIETLWNKESLGVGGGANHSQATPSTASSLPTPAKTACPD
ncbi:MAG: hypothetical protein J4203_03405 [Candidatus Diapherotrites archaeon]|uniref:Class I SAM-dependent methyltransferase n=1 Tax=Candidatus Iainarchaeum sp. TaxID=3101447 RepID=A0A8T4L8D2_9ARCH|nr:hypothetical protein [Candidatus Diapherotrites archaeon]